jgi:hypothetical protein
MARQRFGIIHLDREMIELAAGRRHTEGSPRLDAYHPDQSVFKHRRNPAPAALTNLMSVWTALDLSAVPKSAAA